MFRNRVQIGRHSRWDTGGEAHSASTRKKREFGCRPGFSPTLTPSMPGPIRGIRFSRSCKTGIRVQPVCLVWRSLATGSGVVMRQIASASERTDAVRCRYLGGVLRPGEPALPRLEGSRRHILAGIPIATTSCARWPDD